MAKTAYIYVRVSTEKQELSPEWQEQVCRNYYETSLAPKGYALGQTFADLGQSAFRIYWSEREQGRLLFQAVKSGDIIIVAKQDRAWRSVRDRENTMFFTQQMGIGLVMLDTNMDTTTASGRFASGILALQAQWESDVRRERQIAACAVRKQRRSPGKASPPPGWKLDHETRQLVPDMKERKLLKELFRWRETGVRSIEASCEWLRSMGVKRASGHHYWCSWVYRAWACADEGWPQVGYLKTRDNYKLPKPISAKNKRNRCRNEAPRDIEVHWLWQGETTSHEAASHPGVC